MAERKHCHVVELGLWMLFHMHILGGSLFYS